jgi:hypothetical protein
MALQEQVNDVMKGKDDLTHEKSSLEKKVQFIPTSSSPCMKIMYSYTTLYGHLSNICIGI